MLKLCKKNKLINVGAGGSESPCKIIRYIGENLPSDIQWNNGDLYISTTGGVNKVYKCVLDYDDGNDVTFVEDQFKQGCLYYSVYDGKLNLYDNGQLVTIYDPNANTLNYEDLREEFTRIIDSRLSIATVDRIVIPKVDDVTDPADPNLYYEGDGVPVAITGIETNAPDRLTPENSEIIYMDTLDLTNNNNLDEDTKNYFEEIVKDPRPYLLDPITGVLYTDWGQNNSNISSAKILEASTITTGGSTNAFSVLPNKGLSTNSNRV